MFPQGAWHGCEEGNGLALRGALLQTAPIAAFPSGALLLGLPQLDELCLVRVQRAD